MTRTIPVVALLSVLLFSCGSSAPPQKPQGAEVPTTGVTELAADTAMTLPSGAMFTAPATWSVKKSANAFELLAPEPGSRVLLIDVEADDADAAMAAAWESFGSDKRELEVKNDAPAKDGFGKISTYRYVTSPNERVVVFAGAHQATAPVWTVIILEMQEATFGKRQAQVALISQSLVAKGFERESFADKKAQPLTPERIRLLEEFIENAQKELEIPGVSLALVENGKVILERGFGVKELGKPDKVDEHTLFIAASNTKALTTLLLGTLVDEGKIQWSSKVADIYPGFRLGDAATSGKVEVKHLICACTGLPRQDFEIIFEFANSTPKSTLEVLATMQPTSEFGAMFQYSNPLASAAGYIAGHLIYPDMELGAAYDEAMAKRILVPLGMTNSTFDFKAAQSRNHARPHADDLDGRSAVASMALNHAIYPSRPAGGLWTSAHDLARYVQLELAGGKLADGTVLISEQNLLARRAAQVSQGEQSAYGMGLMVETAYGVEVVHHGGSLLGYLSDMMFLPDHGVGAVILTNSDNGRRMLAPFRRRLLEVLFDGSNEAMPALHAAAQRRRANAAAERKGLTIPADPKVIATIASTYSNDVLGTLKFVGDDQGPIIDVGEWRSRVSTKVNSDKSISLVMIDPGHVGFVLIIGEKDGKRTLTIRDRQHEYVFVETASM